MLEISRHAVTLSTRRFNALPHALWARLGVLPATAEDGSSINPDNDSRKIRRQRPRRLALISRFYDAGIVYGLVATVLSVSLVILAGIQLVWRVLELENALFVVDGGGLVASAGSAIGVEAGAQAGGAGDAAALVQAGIRRRELGGSGPGSGEGASNSSRPGLPSNASSPQAPILDGPSTTPILSPLIPGITVPLWHLFPMLIALLLTQAIHEAGHALAAALSNITPLSSGIALIWPCMPSAFVALPSSALTVFASDIDDDGDAPTTLALREQLRILAAGVWHNAATALLLLLGRALFAGDSTSTNPAELPLVAISGPDALFEPLVVVIDYVFTLSIALAVLNMLPLWGLDGEAFVERVALLLMRRRAGKLNGQGGLLLSSFTGAGNGDAVEMGSHAGPWNGYMGDTSGAASKRTLHGPGGRLLHGSKDFFPTSSLSQSSSSSSSASASTSASAAGGGASNRSGRTIPSLKSETKPEAGLLRGRASRGGAGASVIEEGGGWGGALDLEAGNGDKSTTGAGGRFALTNLGTGPTTVPYLASGVSNLSTHPSNGHTSSSSSILASAQEAQALRALRARMRGVFGLVTIAVLGGTIVLECVLALQQ
ncbi:hypothetical protein V8E36_005293 [Tilletia maclaganii]